MKECEQLHWFSITQNPNRNKEIIRIKRKTFQDNESLSYQIWISIDFLHEGPVKYFDFLEYLQQGFVWSSLFWVFKLKRVYCVYEFPRSSPQI